MLVYVIWNTTNGKLYVGQTVRGVDARWREHCLLQGKCRVLENAIRKYGARAFEVSVVATVETQEELNRVERLTCEALNSYAPHGYNLREGGGAKGKMHEQTKRIMRELALRPERIDAFLAMQARPDVQEKMQVARRARGPQSVATMLASRTPETEARRVAASISTTQSAAYREAQSARQLVAQNAPGVRANRSASITAAWAAMTDDERKSRAAAVSAGTKGVKKTVNHSPEAKAARSAAALKRWANPALQAKHAARMAVLLADPEFLKRRGAAIAAGKAKRKQQASLE